MTRECRSCGKAIDRPLDENANYCISPQFSEKRHADEHTALVHTEETIKKLNKMDRLLPNKNRQAIAAEMAHPEAPDEVNVPAGTKRIEHEDGTHIVTADRRAFPFSVDLDLFDRVPAESPSVINDDSVALVLTETVEVEEDGTALLCSDCTGDDDQILWGVDAE